METIKSWMTEEQPADVRANLSVRPDDTANQPAETAPQQQPAQSAAQPQQADIQPVAVPEPGNAQLAEQLLLAQAENHNRQQQQAYNDWKSTFDQVLSTSLSKGKGLGAKAGDVKRKEAALKSLVGTFGGLADTLNVAFGGTVPVRDVRPDVYATQKEADLLDRQEQQIEQDGRKRQQALVEKLLSLRPKYETNDAIFKLAGTLADRDKYQWTAQQAMERLKQQQAFDADQNEKNRKNRKEIANARNNGSGKVEKLSPSQVVDLNIGGKNYILSKAWYGTNQGEIATNIIDVMVKNMATTPKQKEDQTRALMREIQELTGAYGPAQAEQRFISKYAKYIPSEILKIIEANSIHPDNIEGYGWHRNNNPQATTGTEPEEEFNVEL